MSDWVGRNMLRKGSRKCLRLNVLTLMVVSDLGVNLILVSFIAKLGSTGRDKWLKGLKHTERRKAGNASGWRF